MQTPNLRMIIILSAGLLAFILLIIIRIVQQKWKEEETEEYNQKIFCNLKKTVVKSNDICPDFKVLADIPFGKSYRTCFWCLNAQVKVKNE